MPVSELLDKSIWLNNAVIYVYILLKLRFPFDIFSRHRNKLAPPKSIQFRELIKTLDVEREVQIKDLATSPYLEKDLRIINNIFDGFLDLIPSK